MKNEFDRLVEHLLAGNIFLEEAIELLERRMIQGALECAGNKQTAAAKRLGIHRNTLQRKMVAYKLGTSRPRRKPAARAARAPKRKSAVA
jgi:transcriptional regulator with PAS, ATPase and Fis domain